jgi:hypothetical protein
LKLSDGFQLFPNDLAGASKRNVFRDCDFEWFYAFGNGGLAHPEFSGDFRTGQALFN